MSPKDWEYSWSFGIFKTGRRPGTYKEAMEFLEKVRTAWHLDHYHDNGWHLVIDVVPNTNTAKERYWCLELTRVKELPEHVMCWHCGAVGSPTPINRGKIAGESYTDEPQKGYLLVPLELI